MYSNKVLDNLANILEILNEFLENPKLHYTMAPQVKESNKDVSNSSILPLSLPSFDNNSSGLIRIHQDPISHIQNTVLRLTSAIRTIADMAITGTLWFEKARN